MFALKLKLMTELGDSIAKQAIENPTQRVWGEWVGGVREVSSKL